MSIEITHRRISARHLLKLRVTALSRFKVISQFAGFVCILAVFPLFSQSVNLITPKSQKERAPLSHLYWHFLLYQNHLDRAAADHEQQGKDGRWLSNHFQKQLG